MSVNFKTRWMKINYMRKRNLIIISPIFFIFSHLLSPWFTLFFPSLQLLLNYHFYFLDLLLINPFWCFGDMQKQRESPKVPLEVEVDNISNLPGHIIDKILSHLTLRDAVRTSVVSSKWRYKWITLPNLVFDNQSVLVSSQDQSLVKNKLVNIVDHVLLLHSGPIQKFKLSHRDLQGVSDIDRWILFLSRGSFKEFVLEIWKGHRYRLPSSIYFCQNLVHLELFNCLLKPPATFGGFKNLKSIDLQHITMDQDAFEYLIFSCPLLERLTLMNFDGFTILNIHAPNLLFFDIGGRCL